MQIRNFVDEKNNVKLIELDGESYFLVNSSDDFARSQLMLTKLKKVTNEEIENRHFKSELFGYQFCNIQMCKFVNKFSNIKTVYFSFSNCMFIETDFRNINLSTMYFTRCDFLDALFPIWNIKTGKYYIDGSLDWFIVDVTKNMDIVGYNRLYGLRQWPFWVGYRLKPLTF